MCYAFSHKSGGADYVTSKSSRSRLTRSDKKQGLEVARFLELTIGLGSLTKQLKIDAT